MTDEAHDLQYDPNEVGGDLVVECWISHGPQAEDPGFDPQPADTVILGDDEQPPSEAGASAATASGCGSRSIRPQRLTPALDHTSGGITRPGCPRLSPRLSAERSAFVFWTEPAGVGERGGVRITVSIGACQSPLDRDVLRAHSGRPLIGTRTGSTSRRAQRLEPTELPAVDDPVADPGDGFDHVGVAEFAA